MELDQWIAALFAKVQPAAGSPERAALYLRPRLEDLSPYWFTEDAITGIWMNLRSLNSADRIRKLLRDYHARHAPPRPPPLSDQEREASEWEDRKAWLRRDWDDAAAILRKVHDCGGNVLLLRVLGKLVRLWAPQHLGFLPPHIIEAIETDTEIAPRDLHLRRRIDDDAPPPGTRSVAEQLEALQTPREPRPRYLTPEQLDTVSPLPNGRKRTDASPSATVSPRDTAAAIDPDTAAAMAQADAVAGDP